MNKNKRRKNYKNGTRCPHYDANKFYFGKITM